jgi:hypothetical protein
MSSDLVHIFLLSLIAMFNATLLTAVTVMLLLPNPKPLLVGYLLGAYVTTITLGLVIVFVLPGSGTANTSRHTVSPLVDIGLGLLLLLIAVVLRTGRDRRFEERRRRRKEEKVRERQEAGKPTESLPLRLLGKGDPRVTFLVGVMLSFPGVSYLDALDHIHRLDAGTLATVLLVIYFCLAQLLLLEVPLVGYFLAPERTQAAVSGFRSWMERKGRTSAVIGATVIAVWLLVRGVITLM